MHNDFVFCFFVIVYLWWIFLICFEWYCGKRSTICYPKLKFIKKESHFMMVSHQYSYSVLSFSPYYTLHNSSDLFLMIAHSFCRGGKRQEKSRKIPAWNIVFLCVCIMSYTWLESSISKWLLPIKWISPTSLDRGENDEFIYLNDILDDQIWSKRHK